MTGKPDTQVRAGDDQSRASDPGAFVWVAANAGSGKTHVLVERLARILLAGTPPTRILCLTFTNAAAAEMANRLFQRLAKWSIIDEAKLAKDIEALTGAAPGAAMLARARRLFPTALESPGGLKIYTIHAFCERLLHRFALEAGVSPHFKLVVDRDQRDLIDAARETVMARAAGLARDAPLVEALDTVSALAHDLSLAELLVSLVSRRSSIAALELENGETRDAVFAWLAAKLGVDPDAREEAVIAAEFSDSQFDAATCARAAALLATGGKTDRDNAARFAALATTATPVARCIAHIAATIAPSTGQARKQVMTKALRQANPDIADWIDRELERGDALMARFAGVATFGATRALLILADAVIGEYQRAKAARGLLDYDDLIARARNLLARSDDAAWVLYKLDGGIDHILVDEAQDTSPSQWDIVQYLAEDMLSGASARSAQARTTFAVGDEKQSIFSFQGAEPAMFARMRDFFEKRSREAGHDWARVPLERSYRSAPEILGAVDLVFADPELAAGLGADGAPPSHEAHRRVTGRVEIWPTVIPDDKPAPDPWTVPLDYVGPGDPKVQLAETIASEIAGWLSRGEMLEAEGRAIRPGDIMILVRRRNAFVDALVRALKSRDVPVAGVDRMRLTDQIVVQDLMAAGRFALLPDDDLSLAALIKSPLIGLDEDDLFIIAHGRDASLWQSLQAKARTSPHLETARARLAHWLAMADQMPPYAFYSRILAEDGARRRIAARLGAEAGDPIEEFMNAALAFERDHIASLEGFLAWLTRSEGEIKRDMEHGRDEVRVMTAHGAKGLEANIVILPDTCQTPSRGRGVRLDDIAFDRPGDPHEVLIPVWPQRGGAAIDAVAEARDRADRAAKEEYLRLLYVAMTRARDWLIVTGYDTRRERSQDCWYEIVRRGLAGHLEETSSPEGAARFRLRQPRATGPSTEESAKESPAAPIAPAPLPDWALRPPDRVPTRAGRITPSQAVSQSSGDFLSPLGEAAAQRFSRGLAMHALLEHLPETPRDEWRARARAYLETSASDISPQARADLAEEAIRVLESPDFAPFLTPGARAEVAFAATISGPDGTPVFVEGRIDRLAIVDGTVHVVDYKTHRPAPAQIGAVPKAHLAQMALYRAALGAVFDARPVAVSLLWTDTAQLMKLPASVLDEALHAALTRPEHGPA